MTNGTLYIVSKYLDTVRCRKGSPSPGAGASIRSIGTGDSGEVELGRQTNRS